MNRRMFLKASGTGAAVLALAPTTLLTGCAFSVTGMLNTILSTLNSILSVAEKNAPWLPGLQAAIAQLENAEATWKTGGASAIVIDALNTVEAVLAVVPLTTAYSPLIDVIVAGIEAIINYFNPPAVQLTHARSTMGNNPHVGHVTLDKPGFRHPTYQGAFKAQYNSTAVGIGLPQAAIK